MIAATTVDSPFITATRQVATSRSAVRTTTPLRWVLLVAVFVGVALGAMTCAAGLAYGQGHSGHAAAAAPVGGGTDHGAGHSVAHPDHPSADVVLDAPAAPVGDASGRSPVAAVQGHPGMACVVAVDLQVADTSVVTMTQPFDSPVPAALADGIADLDPPVPRRS